MSYAVSTPLLGFAALALYKVLKARRLKPALHIAGLIGQVATALDELGPSKKGFVMCAGEYWEAVARSQVAPGERVKVVGKEGPTLIVEKLSGGGGGEA
jgi:membrane-bound serine protease (ClpP class)